MKNEERLIEVMTELLAEVHETRKEITGMRGDITKLQTQQVQTNTELAKINLLLSENTRAILKLAEKIDIIPGIIERVTKLESAVFKNPPLKKI